MKKNKLATFLFSLVPGAGEMYFGMYKSGCSIMGLFMGLTALAVFLRIEELLFALPIVWFYSFCHVHNMKNMDEEEFAKEKDETLFGQWSTPSMDWKKNTGTYAHKIIAGLLIAAGGMMVWTNLCDFLSLLPINYEVRYFLRYRIPQLVLGVLIIFAGVWLIRGKKAQLEQREEEEVLESILEKDFHPVINPVAAETLKKTKETGLDTPAEEAANMASENALPEKEVEA